MTNIRRQIEELDEQRAQLLKDLDAQRSRKRFVCACCKHSHAIRDCDAIQTHWYTHPSGCSDGDFWSTGEVQIICPKTNHKNRVMFGQSKVPYSLRRQYEYNAEMQFRRLYLKLFKSVIEDHDEDRRHWENLYYFDEHRKAFHLEVKGVDTKDA